MNEIKDFEKKLVKFNGKKYFLNFDRLKSLCFKNQDEGIKQADITEEYETTDDGSDFSMVSKVVHETKTTGNIGTPTDTSLFDLVKVMILSLLEVTEFEKGFNYDFGTMLSINTLVACGVLEIID